MAKENIENILKTALIQFINESKESDYNTGYWIGEIIESLNLRELILSGFIDKINEVQAEKYGLEGDKKMRITFSINRYDHEGDIFETGIFLNLNEKLIIKVKDIEEIEDIINSLECVIKDIREII